MGLVVYVRVCDGDLAGLGLRAADAWFAFHRRVKALSWLPARTDDDAPGRRILLECIVEAVFTLLRPEASKGNPRSEVESGECGRLCIVCLLFLVPAVSLFIQFLAEFSRMCSIF
jgi:hypothetical protein